MEIDPGRGNALLLWLLLSSGVFLDVFLEADFDGSFRYARSNESSVKHELDVDFRILGQVLTIQRAEAFLTPH